jgi:two-component system, OmpR family, KDP operon response regulator KdpE
MRGRILLIDDEPQILRDLIVSLNARGYETEIASCAQDGLKAAASRSPDLVLIDPDLHDMEGVEVVRSLRRLCRAPIIALSAGTASIDGITALDAGADDYVPKPFDMDELLARIRAASRRAAKASEVSEVSHVRIGRYTVDLTRRAATGPHGEVELTPTEWQVLEVLVRNAGMLVSQTELLAEVPGRAHVQDSSYLRGHLLHLRQKLENDPARPEHLITEPGLGYRFRA